MNPLFDQMMTNNGAANQLLAKFQQFRQGYKGNAQQQVQQMLQSGRVTQEQYNAAVQKAQQLQRMLNGR